MSDSKNDVPQGGTPQGDNTPAGQAGAGPTDFGGGQNQSKPSTSTLRPPVLLVDNKPLSRYGSEASLNSVASCKSVFSNMSSDDFRSCKRDRDESLQLRAQELSSIKIMQAELEKMFAACRKQPNVNQTVKDGLKKFESFLLDVEKKHEQADKVDARHFAGLDYSEETRQYRKEKRKEYAADTIRRVALAARKAEKRHFSSPEEKGKKIRKEETYAEKAKTPPNNKKKKAKMKAMTKDGATPDQPRASTMLIRVSKGQTYASVLGKLRKDVDPELCQTKVIGARQTEKGDLLLRLGGESNREAFTAKVTEVVGAMATVQVPDDQKVTLEIRDLDSLTEETEVVSALERALGAAKTERKVKLLPENRRGIKCAVVIVTRREAAILESLGHVKVGFMSCCVRKRVAVTRCHRCLDFGHKAVQCKGVDRSSACFKCGETGHTLANCKNVARCFLCNAKEGQACDHVAGSGKCAAFRKVLEAAKREEALKRR